MKALFLGPHLAAAEEEAMAATGVTVDVLMEAAGVAVAREVPAKPGRALLLVGPGNNGGDALVAGRYLLLTGWTVTAFCPLGVRSAPALANLRRYQAVGGEVVEHPPAEPPDLVVDGLLGSGANRALAGPLAEAVRWANDQPSLRLAVDIPSGLDPCSGRADHLHLRAHRTVALGAWKPPHVFPPAAEACGALALHPLGVPLPTPDAYVLEPGDVPRPPWRGWHSKHERGRVRLVVGSERYPGAAVLTAAGALGAGAGYVEVALPAALHSLVLGSLPQALVLPREEAFSDLQRVDALVVGPGLGRGEETRAATQHALAAGLPAVLDADALFALSELDVARLPAHVVLTPHRREWERILGAPGEEPFPARGLAERGATVVQKGPATAVLAPGTLPRVLRAGNAVLAQGGSGDVLAGVIGALLALGLPPAEAAVAGVAWHGRAADLVADEVGPVGGGAWRLAGFLPKAARELWP